MVRSQLVVMQIAVAAAAIAWSSGALAADGRLGGLQDAQRPEPASVTEPSASHCVDVQRRVREIEETVVTEPSASYCVDVSSVRGSHGEWRTLLDGLFTEPCERGKPRVVVRERIALDSETKQPARYELRVTLDGKYAYVVSWELALLSEEGNVRFVSAGDEATFRDQVSFAAAWVRGTLGARPWNTALEVNSTPQGAKAILDGVQQGYTPVVIRGLIPGRPYVLKVYKSGYDLWEETVSPGSSIVARLTKTHADTGDAPAKNVAIAAAPSADEFGYLRISSLPWANIRIDGEDTGLSTPVMAHRVTAGRHRVTLLNEKYRCEGTYDVAVNPEETVTLTKQLECRSAPR